jgi:hypothetical protein
MLTFGPLDHDVHVPEFTIWPKGAMGFAATSLQLNGGYLTFDVVPDSFLKHAQDEFEVLPARHVGEVRDDRGQTAWQMHQDVDNESVLTVTDDVRVSGYLDARMLEDRVGQVFGGGFRVGRTYVTDPVGRPIEVRFEYRLVTNGVVTMGLGQVPMSRGAPCDGFAPPCPFTDGDFSLVDAGGRASIVIDLGQNTYPTSFFIRGLWPEQGAAALYVEIAQEETPDQFGQRSSRMMDRDAYRDGVLAPPRIDVQLSTASRFGRYVRLAAVDAHGAPVGIVRLAELSVW